MSLVVPPHKSGEDEPPKSTDLSVATAASKTLSDAAPHSLMPESEKRELATPSQFASGRNLVAFARPYFGLIVVTTLLLVAWGVVAMLNMPSGIYPEVSFPQIAVIVETPAMGIRDVETVITRPIEERVSIVPGVSRLQSKTVRGASEIKIDFAPGTDMVQALNDVRAKLAEIEAQLPAGTTSVVERQSPSVFPIISFVVTGGANPSALRDFAYYDLRPRIGRLDDVAYVAVQGGDLREIIVEVDPQRLVETGISITDVADRLTKDHQLKAVGRLDRGSTQFQVLSNSQAIDPLDLADRVVAVKNDQAICLATSAALLFHTKIAAWRFVATATMQFR